MLVHGDLQILEEYAHMVIILRIILVQSAIINEK
jgi:hypothetical protein